MTKDCQLFFPSRASAFRYKRGITLIELIVVIVILGVLTAVALPNFSGVSADAVQAKVEGVAGAAAASAANASARYKAGLPGAVSPTCEAPGSIDTGGATLQVGSGICGGGATKCEATITVNGSTKKACFSIP